MIEKQKPSRDLYLVAISLFFWGMGEGLFYIFQPLYLQELGASSVLIGTILGINSVGMTVVQVPAGYIADRFGRRPVMWASWTLGSISAIVMALAPGLAWFVVGLVLYGFTTAGVSAMNSYVSTVRGSWSVGKAVSTVSAAYGIGAIFGPLAGGFISQSYGLRNIYAVSAVIFVISTLILFFIRKQAVEAREEHDSNWNLLRNKRFILSLGMLLAILFAMSLPMPLTPYFLQNERGLSLSSIGYLGALQSAGTVLVLLTLGHITPMKGLIVAVVAMIAFSGLIMAGTGMPYFVLAYLLLGAYRLSRSLSLAFIRPIVKDSQVGMAFGAVEAIANFALVLAPVLAGLLYDQRPESVYVVSLFVLAACLVMSVLVFKHRELLKAHWPEDLGTKLQ